MKRFYKEAAVADVSAGFGVALDGKPVRTPARAILALPNAALAEAVAGEWRAQGEEVEPNSMLLMRLGCTAIDRVAPQREAIIEEIAGYGGTDLLCYWADIPPNCSAARPQPGSRCSTGRRGPWGHPSWSPKASSTLHKRRPPSPSYGRRQRPMIPGC